MNNQQENFAEKRVPKWKLAIGIILIIVFCINLLSVVSRLTTGKTSKYDLTAGPISIAAIIIGALLVSNTI
jgi:hypothetical protein